MLPSIRNALLFSVLSAFLPAALSASDAVPDPAPAHPELVPVFEQFGGESGLVALMDDFMQILLADERMRPFFEFSDQTMVKRHLVEKYCVNHGGPCTKPGRDRGQTHAFHGSKRAD
jgi:hemoglobin